MSIADTLLLPEDREITHPEQMEAEEILSKTFHKKFNGFDEFCYWELFNLFDDTEGETGKQPWQYKAFMKWVFKQMLKPVNATALHEKFGEDGGQYLENIMDFFESLSDLDASEKIWGFCLYYNMVDNKRGTSKKELYSLWQNHVNTKQKTPKTI